MPRSTVPNDSRPRSNPKRTPAIPSSRAFGSKSPLVDRDIQSFLALCMSRWDDYTDEEKKDIIQSLPPSRRPQDIIKRNIVSGDLGNSSRVNDGASELIEPKSITQALARPPVPVDIIASDTYLKRAVARLKRDIADGYYEKSWQDRAKQAHEDRSQGKFDDYLKQCASDMFTPTIDEDEYSDYDKEESDEDFVMGAKGSSKKLKISKSR